MSFEFPRLRVKAAKLLNNYSDFVKKPAPFLRELHTTLKEVDPDLALRCETLMKGEASLPDLDGFVGDLKLLLSSRGSEALAEDQEARLDASLKAIKGVGEKLSTMLINFGIETVRDLVYAFPFRYEQLAAGMTGGKGVLSGVCEDSKFIRTRQGKKIFQVLFKGSAGYFSGIWLNVHNNYMQSAFKKGQAYNLYGALTQYNGVPAIFHPEILEDYEIGKLRPIYSAPTKISQKVYQKILDNALQEYIPWIGETLPENLRYKYRYPDIHDALNTLHRPETPVNAELITGRQHPALQRFIYEELFYLQLRLFLKKKSYLKEQGIPYDIPRPMLEDIAKLMPFRLTDAQRQAVREIYGDMRQAAQMNRLLQGDVGSGKTIVSFVSALVAVKNGYQAVILAPTEVLAEQHFANLDKFLRGSGYHACLLTGSVKQKDKKQIKELIAAGDIHFVVGTHAIIQEDVVFKRLGFAVIDEQHRFGVKQRKALMDKGDSAPDILLMTATPIPRTLALTFYGDLDLSEIDSMPPGRIPPITKAFREEKLKEAFRYAAEKLQDGERAYFVYPAIEDSGKSNLKSATKNAEIVQKYFPDKKVELLHGRLKAEEKRELLRYFQDGTIDILVSTTVVEVGVDVKDATVIVIENADRFGLAQLHQLRGRVGRNDKQSYCVLVASENISETGFKRLRAMEEHTSGFKLAQIDLELRGQGDFFGVKQSGVPEFKFADVVKDADIVRAARQDAAEIIEADPKLEDPKNALVKSVLMQRWRDEYEYFLVG